MAALKEKIIANIKADAYAFSQIDHASIYDDVLNDCQELRYYCDISDYYKTWETPEDYDAYRQSKFEELKQKKDTALKENKVKSVIVTDDWGNDEVILTDKGKKYVISKIQPYINEKISDIEMEPYDEDSPHIFGALKIITENGINYKHEYGYISVDRLSCLEQSIRNHCEDVVKPLITKLQEKYNTIIPEKLRVAHKTTLDYEQNDKGEFAFTFYKGKKLVKIIDNTFVKDLAKITPEYFTVSHIGIWQNDFAGWGIALNFLDTLTPFLSKDRDTLGVTSVGTDSNGRIVFHMADSVELYKYKKQ